MTVLNHGIFRDKWNATCGRHERALFQDGPQGILFNPHRDGEDAANARTWLADKASLLMTVAGAFYLCSFPNPEDELACYRLFNIERDRANEPASENDHG